MKRSYAVVTGASSGLGVCFAKRLAKEGYDLILVARRKERLQQLAEELKADYQTESKILVCDLSDGDACKSLMNEISTLPVTVFINNAGFGDCGPFIQGSLDKELNMIDVNVKSVHILTKLALQQMKEKKLTTGYILNVASSAGLFPGGPYMATYYATKAYVTSLTQAIATELKEEGSNIYMGCLCPGPVNTEFDQVANVEFTLKGISADDCVNYAVNQMFRKKTVIIPAIKMKLAVTFGRFIPRKLCVKITGMQQKKKFAKEKFNRG